MKLHPMRRSDSNEGFALAALIIFMTALSIVLAASLPVYQVQAQRELEEELIFRGQEYVRAIQKYQRQFGIFPPSIDALIDTNGIRYLRRPYIDPITGEGFRLLTVNPDGTINGSTLLQAGANPALFQGGTPQMFGAPGSGQGEGGNGPGSGSRRQLPGNLRVRAATGVWRSRKWTDELRPGSYAERRWFRGRCRFRSTRWPWWPGGRGTD